jgi:16S rRNA (uracil1498-N3)-methyltransferase
LPFAFVDDLDTPVLVDGDRHHLERVRRLRPGDELTVGDGVGRFRVVRFGAELEVTGAIESVPAPDETVTIAFALTKGEKPELVVQKLVEIGVDRIVPFVGDRTVVRWDEAKSIRNAERWRTIAREAAAQAHRPHLAEIAEVATFTYVAALPGAVLAHPDGGPPSPTTRTVLVGPEGGWSPAEEATVAGRVRLGPHVLRSETAALVAGALLVRVS